MLPPQDAVAYTFFSAAAAAVQEPQRNFIPLKARAS